MCDEGGSRGNLHPLELQESDTRTKQCQLFVSRSRALLGELRPCPSPAQVFSFLEGMESGAGLRPCFVCGWWGNTRWEVKLVVAVIPRKWRRHWDRDRWEWVAWWEWWRLVPLFRNLKPTFTKVFLVPGNYRLSYTGWFLRSEMELGMWMFKITTYERVETIEWFFFFVGHWMNKLWIIHVVKISVSI